MKEEYIKFIKDFSQITIVEICKDLKVNRSNVLNGNASEETIKKVYDELKKRLTKLNG